MNAVEEGLRADARLAHDEPGLPGLLTVLDEVLLRRWAAGHGVRAPGLRVDRLRHKPSTSLRAALDPGDGGPWWLLTAHSAQTWRKAGKDVRAAASTGGRTVVDEGMRLVLVPAASDRALPWLRELDPAARTLAHNPARRSVVHDARAGRCRKVHAGADVASLSVRASHLLRRNGFHTPDVELEGRHVVSSVWVPGRAVTPADEPAVADLVQRWSALDPSGLPVLGAAGLRTAVRRAAAGAPGLGREFADRLQRTVSRWAARSAEVDALPTGFAHGDLSPDQFVVVPSGPVVLDVDRAGRAPRGWDLASWTAAVVMSGGVARGEVHPVLLAAAALVRTPEPFRRRRPGWAGQTRRLLDLAEGALA